MQHKACSFHFHWSERKGTLFLLICQSTTFSYSSCNLECRYCWNNGGKYGGSRAAYMSREVAQKAIGLLSDYSLENDEILIDFYGGEPLLNFEMVKYAIETSEKLGPRLNRNFRFRITTNGTLLDDETTAYLSDHGVSVGVSIDGPKDVHDLNRPFKSGKGSWDLISANLKGLLHREGVSLEARARLAPPNLNLTEVSRFLYDMGFEQVEVKFADEPANPQEGGGFKLSDEEIMEMRRKYLQYAKSYLDELLASGLSIDYDISQSITDILYHSPTVSYCGAGRSILFVTATGEIYPCLNFGGSPKYRLGSVFEGLDRASWQEFWGEIAIMFEGSGGCKACWARYICGKNCAANNFHHNGDFRVPFAKECEEIRFQKEVLMWLILKIAKEDPSLLERFRPIPEFSHQVQG
ncbi:MAG: radical SAM protein [Actinomycetota bacterium]|nr:radical SAM protein [Actinomycetota bacterium]